MRPSTKHSSFHLSRGLFKLSTCILGDTAVLWQSQAGSALGLYYTVGALTLLSVRKWAKNHSKTNFMRWISCNDSEEGTPLSLLLLPKDMCTHQFIELAAIHSSKPQTMNGTKFDWNHPASEVLQCLTDQDQTVSSGSASTKAEPSFISILSLPAQLLNSSWLEQTTNSTSQQFSCNIKYHLITWGFMLWYVYNIYNKK